MKEEVPLSQPKSVSVPAARKKTKRQNDSDAQTSLLIIMQVFNNGAGLQTPEQKEELAQQIRGLNGDRTVTVKSRIINHGLYNSGLYATKPRKDVGERVERKKKKMRKDK